MRSLFREIRNLEKRQRDTEVELQSKEREIERLKDQELEMMNQNLTRINAFQGDKVSLSKGKGTD